MDFWNILSLVLDVFLIFAALWCALSAFVIGLRLHARSFIISGLGLSFIGIAIALRLIDPTVRWQSLLIAAGLLIIFSVSARTKQIAEQHGLTWRDQLLFPWWKPRD